jgi:hypothetical protein
MLSVMEWAKEHVVKMPTRQIAKTLPLMAEWSDGADRPGECSIDLPVCCY